MTIASQFSDIASSSFFFWHCFVSLVKFSYWSKFHLNIITGSGVMAIYFYKRLTRNMENRNSLSEFYPISGDKGELGIPNLARMSLAKMLRISAKCQGYCFCRFLVTKGKPVGRGGKITPNQIRVNTWHCELIHVSSFWGCNTYEMTFKPFTSNKRETVTIFSSFQIFWSKCHNL